MIFCQQIRGQPRIFVHIVKNDGTLEAGLAAVTPEIMAAKAPFSPVKNEKETDGSLLAGLVFHEGYQVGQLGILRRLAAEEGLVR